MEKKKLLSKDEVYFLFFVALHIIICRTNGNAADIKSIRGEKPSLARRTGSQGLQQDQADAGGVAVCAGCQLAMVW